MVWWLCLAQAQDVPWRQLRSPEASASSFLRSNWNAFTENYHPSYLLDGDPKTAWVEGVAGSGAGEWVSWRVSPVSGVHAVKLRLANGYQKSAGLLTANAAPASLKVELMRADRPVHSASWKVGREMGWQELVLDPPADVAFDAVRLTVESVTEGRTYADLCVSDVELWVHADTAYRAPVENAKHQALLAWIAERKADAAYFAQKPKHWPFASTHYTHADSALPADHIPSFEAEVATLGAQVDALLTTSGLWRLDVRDPVRPPDGLPIPAVVLPFFGGGFTAFEATTEWRPKVAESGLAWSSELTVSHARRQDAGERATWAFRTKEVVEERGVTTTNTVWLVHTEGGRVTRVFQRGLDDGYEGCPGWASASISDWVWADDKVREVRIRRRHGCSVLPDGEDAEHYAPRHHLSVVSADGSG